MCLHVHLITISLCFLPPSKRDLAGQHLYSSAYRQALPAVTTQDTVSRNNSCSFCCTNIPSSRCNSQWQHMGSSQNHCSTKLVLLSFLDQSIIIAYVPIIVPLCLLLFREKKERRKKDKRCKTIPFLTKVS